MSARNTRRHKAVVLLILLFLSAVLITTSVSSESPLRAGYRGAVSLFSYPQKAAYAVWRPVRNWVVGIFGRGRLVAENRELRMQAEALEERIARLEGYRKENEELRRLLDLRQKNDLGAAAGRSMAAEVVGRNPLNWYQTVTIDRGARHGVAGGMVVVSGGGALVGRVVGSGREASSVMLMLDGDSRVSAVAERTGEHGIIAGRGAGALRMEYLSDKTDVKVGDTVRTSGLGGIFPKGILIGAVSGVGLDELGLTASAEVSPAVDFSRLETVLILKN